MNSPASNEATLEVPAKFNTDQFREGIAQRCANILRVCHLNKIKMDYKISPVLACITLIEMEGLKNFQSHIHEKLAMLLGLELQLVEVTVTSIMREDDTKSQQGSSKREEYLHIKATIKQQ